VSAIDWRGATRAQRRWFVLAIVVGVVIRVAMLISKWRQDLLLNDSLWYSAQAVKIAGGDGFVDPFYGGPSAEHGPLTPLLVAPVSWMDDPVPWQRAAMTVVGVGVVAGVGLLARRVGGWWAGVIAAALAAVYPNLWMNDSLVMSEAPAALFVVVTLWLALDLLDALDRPDPDRRAVNVRLVACGVAIGLAALARSELVLLAPLLVIVVWRARPTGGGSGWIRSAAVLCCGTFVVLAPWVSANLVRFDTPVLFTTNDGTTLLGANCHDAYYGSDIGGWSLFCVVDERSPLGEDPGSRSARHRRIAISYARDHIGRLPLIGAARLGRGLDIVGIENQVDGDVGEERYRWASWAGVASWWAMAALAAIGIRRVTGRARWVLLTPVVGVAITTVLFYGAHRIRSPMEPVVVVLAAIALGTIAERRATRA
jgi:4-amino-4-deoxy-L-arabinose transferase-like glycosyltransferase